ncbi:unnamed protein product, partial [Musa banksii]
AGKRRTRPIPGIFRHGWLPNTRRTQEEVFSGQFEDSGNRRSISGRSGSLNQNVNHTNGMKRPI